MSNRTTLSDVRDNFLKLTKYFSTQEVSKYHKQSAKVLELMEQLEKTNPELIKEHNEVLKVLLNNYDQQIQNINAQLKITNDFLDCVAILEVKPDDKNARETIVEYKKNLGLL